MSTPERKLTVETYTTNSPISFPNPSIIFNIANLEVFRITHDARMICGEGLSTEEATQKAAKLLIASFDEQIQKMVDARAAAEREKVRVLREALDDVANSGELMGYWFLHANAVLAATKEASK